MLMNGIGVFVSALLIFTLGAVCGVTMVYRFRHVTTKSLHQSLLNTLQLQLLEQSVRSSTDDEAVLVVLEDE